MTPNNNLYVALTYTIFCTGIKLLSHVYLIFLNIKAGSHSLKGSKFKKKIETVKEEKESYNIEKLR